MRRNPHPSGWHHYVVTDAKWAEYGAGFFAPSLAAARDYAERHFDTRKVEKAEAPATRRNSRRRNPAGATTAKGAFRAQTWKGWEDREGYVSDNGIWGINKVGDSWILTHTPTGRAFPTRPEDTLGDLKNMLVVMPSEVYDADTEAQVMEHGAKFHRDLTMHRVSYRVAKGKRAAAPSAAEHHDRVMDAVKDAGLARLGQYFGRSGEYYGRRDHSQRGSASLYAISVGKRDVSLQRRVIERDGDMRWVLEETELKSKVTPEKLDRWIQRVKAADTAASVKQAQREGRSVRYNPRTRRNGQEVAQTILKQMGGTGRLVAMIGAKDFIAYPNAVAFKFANAGAGKPNYVKITLAPSDTYDVEFGRVRGRDYKVIKSFDDVYAESLRRVFESTTGLYLSL
jgi:hypothetical protein